MTGRLVGFGHQGGTPGDPVASRRARGATLLVDVRPTTSRVRRSFKIPLRNALRTRARHRHRPGGAGLVVARNLPRHPPSETGRLGPRHPQAGQPRRRTDRQVTQPSSFSYSEMSTSVTS